MEQIFISYKRTDKDRVFPIVEEIKKQTGVDCWVDLEGIESGDQFQNVIIDAIDNADVVVFMLSKSFIAPYIDEKTGKVNNKKQTFPEKEVMYALNEGKRLVPVSIDGTMVNDCKWLKFNCGGLDCINWENQDQRTKFYKNISCWLTSGKNLPSTPHIEGRAIFKLFSNENCQVLLEGIKVCALEGKADVPVYLPVSRKGEYRFKFINVITLDEQIKKETIDFDEEKEVSVEWTNNRRPLLPIQEFPDIQDIKGEEYIVNLGHVRIKMIRVEGGKATIGATNEQLADAESIESPEHNVTLSTFYMSQFPITQNVWEVVMGYNKSIFKNLENGLMPTKTKNLALGLGIGSAAGALIGGVCSALIGSAIPIISSLSNCDDKSHYPVENITHDEALEFISRLSKMTNLNFSLPSEDEWEYAARGGQKSLGYKYSGSDNIDDVAWYKQNSQKTTHPVGEKQPNELGLYDMSGNVWEWTETPAHSYVDIIEGYSGEVFIRRGGSWWHEASNCRVSKRYASDRRKKTSGLGLRVVIRIKE